MSDNPGACLFLMLNPSTKSQNPRKGSHPSRSRCENLTREMRFGTMLTCNLFAYRTPDTDELWMQEHPAEPPDEKGANDRHIREAVKRAEIVVCAWGNGGASRRLGCLARRIQRVLEILDEERAHNKLHALYKDRQQFTREGQPAHPGWRELPSTPNCMRIELRRLQDGILKIEPRSAPGIDRQRVAAPLNRARPDESRKSAGRGVSGGPVSNEVYQRFWSAFLPKFEAAHPGWNSRARPSQKRPSIRFVAAGVPWRYRAGFHRGRLFVGLRPRSSIDADTARKAYGELEKRRDTIERAFGEKLDWQTPDDGRSNAGISFYGPDDIKIADEGCWQEASAWLIPILGKLREAVNPVLKELSGCPAPSTFVQGSYLPKIRTGETDHASASR